VRDRAASTNGGAGEDVKSPQERRGGRPDRITFGGTFRSPEAR